MAEDDLDKLLIDVRKTISDNQLFLEKLIDETIEEDEPDAAEITDNKFEEL